MLSVSKVPHPDVEKANKNKKNNQSSFTHFSLGGSLDVVFLWPQRFSLAELYLLIFLMVRMYDCSFVPYNRSLITYSRWCKQAALCYFSASSMGIQNVPIMHIASSFGDSGKPSATISVRCDRYKTRLNFSRFYIRSELLLQSHTVSIENTWALKCCRPIALFNIHLMEEVLFVTFGRGTLLNVCIAHWDTPNLDVPLAKVITQSRRFCACHNAMCTFLEITSLAFLHATHLFFASYLIFMKLRVIYRNANSRFKFLKQMHYFSSEYYLAHVLQGESAPYPRKCTLTHPLLSWGILGDYVDSSSVLFNYTLDESTVKISSSTPCRCCWIAFTVSHTCRFLTVARCLHYLFDCILSAGKLTDRHTPTSCYGITGYGIRHTGCFKYVETTWVRWRPKGVDHTICVKIQGMLLWGFSESQ